MEEIKTNIAPPQADLPRVKTKTKKVIVIAILLIWFVVLFSAGYVFGKVTEGKINVKFNPFIYKQTELPAIFQNSLIRQVWTILKTDFVDKDKIDDKKLFYGALAGFVSGADDPYTVFFDPDLTKDFESQVSGKFEGIGAEIGLKDGILTVVAPLPGTPAARAGLLAGDKIYSIDGKETVGMSLDQAIKLIRGPQGTKVTLLVMRGDDEPRAIEILRDVIEIESVKWRFRGDGIAYVELNSFNSDTMDLFKKFIAEFKTRKIKGIVFDLRNDPGGLLDTAIDVSSLWLTDKLVVIEKFGDGRETRYESDGNAVFKNYPTVVLINNGSASGSEIVAGAFQDYKIATLVGQKSFGKGSVQELRKMPDGSSIKVTVAKWLTPNGRTIDREGIEPDVKVEITKEDAAKKIDTQLNKAIAILIGK